MAHILVVDDERDVVHMVSRILRDEGHHVTCVRTGEQALDFLRRELVDLVILDRALPQLSGEQVLDTLRSDEATARLPVLTMTADFVRLPDAQQAVESGLDEFLCKPFMAETLLHNVARLLERMS